MLTLVHLDRLDCGMIAFFVLLAVAVIVDYLHEKWIGHFQNQLHEIQKEKYEPPLIVGRGLKEKFKELRDDPVAFTKAYFKSK